MNTDLLAKCSLLFVVLFLVSEIEGYSIPKNPNKSPGRKLIGLADSSTVQKWTANELWNKSTSSGLKFTNGSISLNNQILVENDAPGIGSIHEDAWELVKKGIFIRKHLFIEHWPLREAILTMMVYTVDPFPSITEGKLEFRINGNDMLIHDVKHNWISLPVPISFLKQGENTIEITAHDNNMQFRIPIALYSNYKYGSLSRTPPDHKSSRSLDGGKTWVNQNLGVFNRVNGEYPIRLKIKTFTHEGSLQTPIIEVAGKAIKGVLHKPVSIDNVQLDIEAERKEDIIIKIRSGKTHHPAIGGWTDWRILDKNILKTNFKDQFIQLKFEFSTTSCDKTPLIYSIRVFTNWRYLDTPSLENIVVTDVINYPLIPSSFEFQHEDPIFSGLQEFRQKYKLDKVVAGSKTEMEKILRLRGWVSGLWEWYLPDPALKDLVAWDARSIMDPDTTVEPSCKRGGNCLYYAIVFAQACQSFGITVRMVSINYSIWGGHEVPEVWSREYNKWIMMDTQFDAMYVYKKTGVPLSALELHRVFLDAYYPQGELIDRDGWTITDRDERAKNIDPENLPIQIQIGGHALSGHLGEDYVWWKVTKEAPAPGYNGGYGFCNTAEIRWLPRSNWLSQSFPMPLSHGRTHWGWEGYLSWTDEQTPETPEHRHYVHRESDMYGMLFTVNLSAEIASPGHLQLELVTDSPGFSHFEIIDNQKILKTSNNLFEWELLPGSNILEVRSVDVLGNKGQKSKVAISYLTPVKKRKG